MAATSSLVDLCFAAVADELLCDDENDYLISGIFELPWELLDGLVMHFTPLVLHKLPDTCPFEPSSSEECGCDFHQSSRKRKRYNRQDGRWKAHCMVRWPIDFLLKQAAKRSNKSGNLEELIDDWQQMYWETHLQDCVDAVAETALLPSYSGSIGEIKIPDDILKVIGCKNRLTELRPDYLNFSYHCQQFGSYSRHLRLPNSLVTKICDLLQTNKLVSLEVNWIKTNDNIEGLCKLLKQNSDTLKSLYLIHCKLSPTLIDAICDSMQMKGLQVHGIEHFAIKRSSFFQTDSSPVPSGFATFLTSARHLRSLTLCDDHLGRNFARGILDCLVDAASAISELDLSENSISGFVTHLYRRSSSSSLGTAGLLQTLQVLNLRACNLEKDDIYCLKHALRCLPNLDRLNLSHNVIEDGIRSLIFYFNEISNRDPPFVDLKLENCDLTCYHVIELLEVLTKLKKPLNRLSLNGNRLGSKFGTAFGKFLCTGISKIDVKDIGLGSSGFALASKEVNREVEISSINISYNQGGIEAAKFISALVSHIGKGVVVEAMCNGIPAEALPPLSSVICSEGKELVTILCSDVGGGPYDHDP